MAYICKNDTPCGECEHYKQDEDGQWACFAVCDIKNDIPERFYQKYYEECIRLYGEDVFKINKEGFTSFDQRMDDGGCVEAFLRACKRANIMWLFRQWYHALWDRSDEFDYWLANEMKRRYSGK